MSGGLNRVTLLGNLGADPELRVTQSGTSVLNLRLATSEKWTNNDGVKQERTEWHTIAIWGKRGEALHRYLFKGSRILVEGSIRNSSYEDREGIKRYRTQIVASNIVFAGGDGTRREQGDQDEQPPPRDSASSSPADPGDGSPSREPTTAMPPPPDPGENFPSDDDIPF